MEVYRGTLWLSLDVKEGGVELLSLEGRECNRAVCTVQCQWQILTESERAPGTAQCEIKPCPRSRVSQASAC